MPRRRCARGTRAGQPLAVYSSGSVPAQKLLFGHSRCGRPDAAVLRLVRHRDRPQARRGQLRRIAEALGARRREIVFLSDVVEELDAAREAGMRTVLLDRREDYPQPRTGEATHGHERVESFADIALPA